MMRCFVRFSDETNRGRPKPRPEGFSKRKCLENLLEVFGRDRVLVIADCVKSDTEAWLAAKAVDFHATKYGNGGDSFLHAVDLALREAASDSEAVYLVEDDYLHLPRAPEILAEGLEFGDYATLYDHPDKYLEGPRANSLVSGRSEVTRLYRSKSVHWKLTNSTTLTFATRVACLRADRAIYAKYCGGGKSKDFAMWSVLRRRAPFGRGRKLVSSVPGFSTHAHLPWISPNPEIEALLETLRSPSA